MPIQYLDDNGEPLTPEQAENLEKILDSIRTAADSRQVIEIFEELTGKNEKSNSIILPETENYSELLVPLDRLSYGPEVARVAQRLGLSLRNNEQGYIGNITFEQAQNIANALNGIVTTPDIFADFLRTLKLGSRGEIIVYDGNRRQILESRLEQVFKDATEQINPWRAEILGHRYSRQRNQLFVTYHIFDSSGNLIEVTEPLDPDTLMQTRGISLEHWLNKNYRTSQGLPRRNIPDGSLFYWHPKGSSVAWFGADANWASLYCDGGPLGSVTGLGVRLVRKNFL